METNHLPLSALLRLHAELGGKIKDNKSAADRLAADMRHVEAVIQMLSPGYDVRGIAMRRRRQGNPWFKRGECFQHALDVLRLAEAPLTSREVCRRLLVQQGVAQPTAQQLRDMVGAVHHSFQNHRGKTVLAVGEGMPVRWTVAGITS